MHVRASPARPGSSANGGARRDERAATATRVPGRPPRRECENARHADASACFWLFLGVGGVAAECGLKFLGWLAGRFGT